MASIGEGLRVYAVGDVHGRFDLLRSLYDTIGADLALDPPAFSAEVFLGDYVDRGRHSRDVLDWLIEVPPATDNRVCLLGNHEAMLLAALADADAFEHWLTNGGAETMFSYHPGGRTAFAGMTFAEARSAFAATFPEEHRAFVESLPRMLRLEDYLFVHAGLNPDRPIEAQDPEELVWIREPFLESEADFGCVVVHGHTPVEAPDVRRNRINIDTGAVFSGRLTCLVLEGGERRFLST